MFKPTDYKYTVTAKCSIHFGTNVIVEIPFEHLDYADSFLNSFVRSDAQ